MESENSQSSEDRKRFAKKAWTEEDMDRAFREAFGNRLMEDEVEEKREAEEEVKKFEVRFYQCPHSSRRKLKRALPLRVIHAERKTWIRQLLQFFNLR